ncbi:hypothetical protein [Actinomyces sp.]|uniref:FitA-like ribbon-helix-helix domain-containing protein n=1 Tax=Actinomyces sp. TaxID=29317 RepID=UPI0026DC0973|nr:hypothetical protein [Actinomyces sp.]MDO4899688.1 hypothetical protein [Actinomyces sp.]
MATLTIRNLDDGTHARLRQLAAQHNRSVEAEVRHVLDEAAARPTKNIALALREAALAVGGLDLELPPRENETRAVDL